MLHAVPVFPIVTTKVQPCLVITDIPCVLAPIADKNHPDLLDEGGALPRSAEGQVSLKGLQHIGARARDFPDLHSVKVPPGGFPSATASSALGAQPVHNVYAVYAAAEPPPGVQAQLDFRTLLGHHSDMVEKDRQLRAAPDAEGDVTGASDWSSSPKRISELAENTLASLHNQGWYAIDLFEVVLVWRFLATLWRGSWIKLPGYGVSFNFKRERSFGKFGHFYDGQRVGLWLGPDGPHEGNHQGPCQMKYGGESRCPQLTGVNCNVHEQKHSKKPRHLPSGSVMGFDTFTFNITLINDLENVKINRKTCSVAVSSATEHPHERLHACRKEVWTCGRCFCSKPLIRSFDQFGELRITHM
ncbi:unnamed protein product [Ectocarpus sp. CCAP 1310/34]|nr:unnamed protein product [Ectocarpus sp. CCAP 1310/34]